MIAPRWSARLSSYAHVGEQRERASSTQPRDGRSRSSDGQAPAHASATPCKSAGRLSRTRLGKAASYLAASTSWPSSTFPHPTKEPR